jgi:hypothetical protein
VKLKKGRLQLLMAKPKRNWKFHPVKAILFQLIIFGPLISGNAFSGSLAVSWDPVQDSHVAGYKIKYGTAHGSYPQSVNVAKVTSYILQNLTEGASYYLTVVAYDTNFVEGMPSQEASGTVLKASNISATSISSKSAVITWQTNKPSDSQVDYGTSLPYGSTSPLNSILVLNHSQTLTNLSPAKTYNYRIRSKDEGGSVTVSANFTFTTSNGTDTTAPNISGVSSSSVTANSATIKWTTDEDSDSQVEFGLTTSYGTSSNLVTTLTKAHSVNLTGLQPGKTYYYRVKSKDAAGNLATSPGASFSTATSDTTPPGDVQNLTALPGNSQVTLSWTNPSDSDFKGVMIRYRTDGIFPANKSDGILLLDRNESPGTSDSYLHSGLKNGLTYSYSAFSYDSSQNYSTTAHAQATPNVLTIVSLSPQQGKIGTIVVISGSGFGASKGTSTVSFNGVPAPTSAWSNSSISATVPDKATSGAVVVTVNGVQSNGLDFKVTKKLPAPGRFQITGN